MTLERAAEISPFDYEKAGRFGGAIDQDAEGVLAGFPDDQQTIERLFRRITEKGEGEKPIRKPETLARLAEITELDPPRLGEIVAAFAARDLLVLRESGTKGVEVDLPHECLGWKWKRLKDWIDQEAALAKSLEFLRDSTEKKQFLTGSALAEALQLREQGKLNGPWPRRYLSETNLTDVNQWLDRSKLRDEAERLRLNTERRRTRITAIIALLVVLGLAGLTSWAWRLKARADEQSHEAQIANQKAQNANIEFLEALHEQKRITKDLQLQNLEARRLALINNGDLEEADDSLIALETRPTYLSFYHLKKSQALTAIGDLENALKEATRALEISPDSLDAVFNLGYVKGLLPKEDFGEAEMRRYRKAYPHNFHPHLSLAVIQGMQGKYDDAQRSIKLALDNFQYNNETAFSNVLFPDVQEDIGGKVIYTLDNDLYAAMNYEPAILHFVRGGGGFEETLEKADCRVYLEHYCQHAADAGADKNPSPVARSKTPFLLALNWAYMHYRARPDDYGALAAYGALWERAAEFRRSYKSRALRAYEIFQAKRASPLPRQQIARYQEVAKFVDLRLTRLRTEGVSDDTEIKEDDPLALAEQALEVETFAKDNLARASDPQASALAKKDLARANELLTLAIQKAEKDQRSNDLLIRLLIQRAGVRKEANDMTGKKADCNRILELAPRNVVACP